MLVMGCIQALNCNTNECPTGVATSDPKLWKGLHVQSKSERVYRNHHETVHHFVELLGALGLNHPREVARVDVNRRMVNGIVKTYEELHPSVASGQFLEAKNPRTLHGDWQIILDRAQPGSFSAVGPRPHVASAVG